MLDNWRISLQIVMYLKLPISAEINIQPLLVKCLVRRVVLGVAPVRQSIPYQP